MKNIIYITLITFILSFNSIYAQDQSINPSNQDTSQNQSAPETPEVSLQRIERYVEDVHKFIKHIDTKITSLTDPASYHDFFLRKPFSNEIQKKFNDLTPNEKLIFYIDYGFRLQKLINNQLNENNNTSLYLLKIQATTGDDHKESCEKLANEIEAASQSLENSLKQLQIATIKAIIKAINETDDAQLKEELTNILPRYKQKYNITDEQLKDKSESDTSKESETNKSLLLNKIQ